MVIVERLHIVLALVIFAAGVWAAVAARPPVKRLLGVVLALSASSLVSGASGAPAAAAAAAAALICALAWAVFAAALGARLKEEYAVAEADEVDAVEDAASAQERLG